MWDPTATSQSDETEDHSPRRRPRPAALLLALGGAANGAPPPRAPSDFFGIGPQTPLTARDAEYMKAGGIGVVRLAVPWSSVQSSRRGGYNWAGLDEGVSIAARAGLKVLPFLYGTPHWLAAKPTTLPIDNGKQRTEWKRFLAAAVERYGPRGDYWREHRRPGPARLEPPVPKLPIRTWQIWNEANFFYFAYPTSPSSLREAGQDLQPGDQNCRPGRQGDPLRPLREADGEGRPRGCRPSASWPRSTGCPG